MWYSRYVILCHISPSSVVHQFSSKSLLICVFTVIDILRFSPFEDPVNLQDLLLWKQYLSSELHIVSAENNSPLGLQIQVQMSSNPHGKRYFLRRCSIKAVHNALKASFFSLFSLVKIQPSKASIPISLF